MENPAKLPGQGVDNPRPRRLISALRAASVFIGTWFLLGVIVASTGRSVVTVDPLGVGGVKVEGFLANIGWLLVGAIILFIPITLGLLIVFSFVRSLSTAKKLEKILVVLSVLVAVVFALSRL